VVCPFIRDLLEMSPQLRFAQVLCLCRADRREEPIVQVQCQFGLLVRDLVHRSGGGCKGGLQSIKPSSVGWKCISHASRRHCRPRFSCSHPVLSSRTAAVRPCPACRESAIAIESAAANCVKYNGFALMRDR
jgi:hypothetical protein